MYSLCQGRIILAEVTDPTDQNKKLRPLIIITSSAEIAAVDPIAAVAVTTSFSLPLSDDEVLLPQGTTRTGLTKSAVALCTWICKVKKADIVDTKGIVPKSTLLEILKRVPTDFS